MNEIINSLIEKFYAEHREATPSILYHYTTAQGLINILDSQCIWLTDSRFMNDRSEIMYGQSLVLSQLELMRFPNDPAKQNVVDTLRDEVPTYGGQNAIYSFSFCEDKNLLSQWRGYGATEGGYSIGFETFHMIRLLDHDSALLKVNYSQVAQQRIITDALVALIDSMTREELSPFRSKEQDTLNQRLRVTSDIWQLLLLYCVSFKHPSFSEEQEWRIVVVHPSDEKPICKFRPRGGNVVPYVPVSFAKAVEFSKSDICCVPFPIREIVIGPTLDGSINEESVKQFLRSINWEHIPIVEASETPLRWI